METESESVLKYALNRARFSLMKPVQFAASGFGALWQLGSGPKILYFFYNRPGLLLMDQVTFFSFIIQVNSCSEV